MKLWLDDLRPVPYGYEGARSVNESKQLILEAEHNGIEIEALDLDHELGDYADQAAKSSGCWTGWQNVRPFIRWRSIRPTRWGEPTWRGFWPDTGENSTGRKFCDNLTNG